MADTIEIIKDKIKEVAFKKVGDTDELIKSGILSSILVVDLATILEEEFSVSIPFTEITPENFSSAELIKKYIETKTN
ncbi:MAG: acyl carrier protein [Bacteroidia bacterium]|nr:acyl carrier protein [Bacteroidia bacterium]